MKSYLVILKLSRDENTYYSLINYLKTAINWARPTQNVWIIKTPLKASQVRDGIATHISVLDKVLVISVNNDDWATFRFDQNINDWLKTKL